MTEGASADKPHHYDTLLLWYEARLSVLDPIHDKSQIAQLIGERNEVTACHRYMPKINLNWRKKHEYTMSTQLL